MHRVLDVLHLQGRGGVVRSLLRLVCRCIGVTTKSTKGRMTTKPSTIITTTPPLPPRPPTPRKSLLQPHTPSHIIKGTVVDLVVIIWMRMRNLSFRNLSFTYRNVLRQSLKNKIINGTRECIVRAGTFR